MVPQECIQHQEQLVVGETSENIVEIPTVQDQVIIQEISRSSGCRKLFQRSDCNSTSSNKLWTSPFRAGLCREHSRSVRRVLWRQCEDVDYCRDVEQALCRRKVRVLRRETSDVHKTCFLDIRRGCGVLREGVRTRCCGSSQQEVDGLRPCLSSRSSIAILQTLCATVVGRSRHRNERRA